MVLEVSSAASVPPVPLSRPRRVELDGIRGLAIAMVLVWHYVGMQVQATPASTVAYGLKLLSMTWAGVDLFFVLSGFLIGGILLDTRDGGTYFSTFYLRRACRIIPLYGVSLMVFASALALSRAGGGAVPLNGWIDWLLGPGPPLWSYATFTQNVVMADRGSFGPNWMGVTWSLALEEQFYLLVPVIVWFIPRRLLPRILWIMVLSAPVSRTALYAFHPDGGLAGYLLLPSRWDAFFLGLLAACTWRDPEGLERLRASLPAVRAAVATSVLLLIGLLVAGQNIGSLGMSIAGHSVIAIGCLGLIVLALLSDRGMTRAISTHPWLVWLGTVSYGVYLFHQPMAGLLHGLLRAQSPRIAGMTDAAITVLALGSTLLLAEMSARYFERPIVAWGHRLTDRKTASLAL